MRRTMLTTVAGTLTLRRTGVDLAGGVLRVLGTKTGAAERTVRLLPVIRDTLAEHRAAHAADPASALAFRTATGEKQDASSIRNRDLRLTVRLAAAALADAGAPPFPGRITQHTFRRTYTSLLFALWEAPPAVMRALGYADARLILEVYAAEMDRADGEPGRLRALFEGAALLTPQSSASSASSAPGMATSRPLERHRRRRSSCDLTGSTHDHRRDATSAAHSGLRFRALIAESA